MSATLLSMEKEVLEEGREWTRRRFQERLQEAADAILPVCEQSGLVLKRQQKMNFTLMTVSGTVSIEAIRGYSSATGSWHCPVARDFRTPAMRIFSSSKLSLHGLQGQLTDHIQSPDFASQ